MPPNTIYVGRPSKWGNPFIFPHKIPSCPECGGGFTDFEYATKEDSVEIYRVWIFSKGWVLDWQEKPTIEEIKRKLKDKNLCCWCSLDQRCHADVLLQIANS